MKTLAKIRALARDEKTFYERRKVDIDPALAPVIQRIVHELKTSGIAKVDGFWSREKALRWGENLSHECRVRAEGRSAEIIKTGQTATVSEDVQVRAGGNRWNRVEGEYPELMPEFGEHPLVKNAATLYQGRCKVERLAFQESFPDESLDRMLSEGKRYEVGLGRGWHVDTWSHSLKAFVLLSDVAEENGPFQHVSGSHRLGFSKDSLLYLRMSWPVLPPDPLVQSHLYLDEDQSRGIEQRRDIVAGTGRAGTLYLSDTRAFHRAKPVISGVRRVLWNYFA
jgi:Phytanoyl-CoA dioxygenase (PhyH)